MKKKVALPVRFDSFRVCVELRVQFAAERVDRAAVALWPFAPAQRATVPAAEDREAAFVRHSSTFENCSLECPARSNRTVVPF